MRGAVPDLDPSAPPGPLTLGGEEAEIVAAEAAAAARVLGEPRRADASRLAEAARSGTVPPELLGILSEVAAASLQGGRARRLYRAEGERCLTGVLLRTAAGRELRRGLDDVNVALGTLAGRRLEGVRVAMRRPGSFTVSIDCEGVAITLATTAAAVTVDSLTV
ncbi:MAG: hypothetical protein KJ056_00170 [Acidimicrobiia bacterium]|nr:hypothetical protein [Acidimicrobiia bacterium]